MRAVPIVALLPAVVLAIAAGCEEGGGEAAPDTTAAVPQTESAPAAPTAARPSGSALGAAKNRALTLEEQIAEQQAELEEQIDRQVDPDG